MKKSQRDECENIVELLVKDYFAKYRSDLNNKIGSITADFIKRGLYNSTAMVTKKMSVEFEYLDGMVNYVIESLKKDFGHISLGNCKDKLVAILETEYKKLIPFTNSLLVKAGLANQANLDNFQKRILDELEKTKEKVEIQCAIAEKQKADDKDAGDNEKASRITLKAAWIKLAAAIICLVGAILTCPYWGPWLHRTLVGSGNGTKISTASKTSGDSSPGIVTLGPNSPVIVNYGSPELRSPSDANNVFKKTPLYARTRKRVNDLEQLLIKEKLTPWMFLHTGKMKEVTDYYGKTICYRGVEFEGMPQIVFWGNFIEPFLENGIMEVFGTTVEECRKSNLEPKNYIEEASRLLETLISRVYNYMAETDQILRGKGYPDEVKRVDVSDKIAKMNKFLEEHKASTLLISSESARLDTKPAPLFKEDERQIEPEEREGDVNRPRPSPIIKKAEPSIEPEER